MNSKKRPRYIEGDFFSIPLMDGSNCGGQILSIEPKAMNSVICGVYSDRLYSGHLEFLDNLIAVHFVTRDLLKEGVWRVFDNSLLRRGIEYKEMDIRKLRNNKLVGLKIIGSGIIVKLLEAYHGLRPWDAFHNPNYLDGLLLPGVKRPENVVLEKNENK